jgi:hypothetical protein
MGMDVYGKEPTSETGKYFRNSAWWWRPLWNYAHAVAPDIIDDKLHKSGHYNDGAGLDRSESIRLATRLEAEIATGRCAIIVNDYMAHLDGIPDEDCRLCHGTGVRTDAIGASLGQHVRVIDKPNHPRHGQTGWCNGCDGMGHIRPSQTCYPIDVDNVQKFAAFLRDCGGFEIL